MENAEGAWEKACLASGGTAQQTSFAFLASLREATEKHGIILIFDEVMTGFRVAYGGAQTLYDIRPDLTCF